MRPHALNLMVTSDGVVGEGVVELGRESQPTREGLSRSGVGEGLGWVEIRGFGVGGEGGEEQER